MSVIYNGSVRNNRLTQVVNAIDGGGANASLQILDSANNVLSTIALARPSGIVVNQTLTFSGLSLVDPNAAGTGTGVAARIADSTGTIVVSGLTVGPAGTDIVLTPTTFINAGAVIAIQAATITGN